MKSALFALVLCLSAVCVFSFTPNVLPLRSSHASVGLCRSIVSARIPRRRASLFLSKDSVPSVNDASNSMEEEEEEEVISSTLSDEELESRIASLGLGKEGGVEDKSTGEEQVLTPMERAQKETIKIGTTAIAATANTAISLLNKMEQPIDEEQWKSMQGKDKQEVKEDSEFVNQGGVFVVLPVILAGGGLLFWAVASENSWF
ncbi:hypothetical protein GUITHDRAFT_160465 [Guillardia theta CCMP2712]|uniref:Transmembrane protein n=1 Tax=Guillardia theta (strain CCMP2712) TaxID=905079 RepID=L1K3Q5_GUITC|nr:hypothetical protein GUITHDRAFT_160465 [Guillardia theta CCMP2712]EKX55441.1 hypothetical protein GUITHDRAFT_160465 [Guillardia theta CCMP2712]|eukprot:XP_005842421.1 hypothetical protein GUITHDRAFT_160465 [Guillardia theta CCMP2712]